MKNTYLVLAVLVISSFLFSCKQETPREKFLREAKENHEKMKEEMDERHEEIKEDMKESKEKADEEKAIKKAKRKKKMDELFK